MAAPVADSYTTASGGWIAGGRFVLPDWVPPPGYFADVPMINTPVSVQPAIYPAGATMDGPFDIWGGSAILRDYSALGAQVYYSGGHESVGTDPNIQMSLVCDFSTLTWATKNVPVAPNVSNTFVDSYAPDGTPYCPHTYLGLQELPVAWGGGSKGSLVSFFFAGGGAPNKINLLDVNQATNGYSILSTNQPQNAQPDKISFSPNGGASASTYPISVQDDARQGWWVATNGTVSYTLFVSRTGEITQYPALGGNMQDGSLVLCNSLNLLIALDGGYTSNNSHRTLYIRDLNTGTVTSSLTLGDVPLAEPGYDGPDLNYRAPGKMGLQWVDELGYIVGLDESTTPPTLVKLTPPETNPATNQWTWSTIPLSHWTAGDPTGQANLQAATNRVWSKLRWVQKLHAFVYGAGKTKKPQVIRL